MQCKIGKYKPATLKPGRVTFIVGKRGCGKSTLLRDLLYHMRDQVDYAVAMCPTMESATMLKEILPECSVFDRYMPSIVEQVVAIASHFSSKNKTRRILLCLDDCLYDKSVLKSSAMRQIFFNGRHLNITFIALAQYCMDISPDLRTNIDYLFVMKENIISNRQKLWKFLFGCIQNFDDFCALMDRCTQNYECLCLDNTLQGGAIQDCVFWYKAETAIGEFCIGKQAYFRLSEQTRRTDVSSLPPPMEDSSAPVSRGRRSTLSIVKEEDCASASEEDAR